MSVPSLLPFLPFALGGLLLAVAWWRHRVRERGGRSRSPLKRPSRAAKDRQSP